MHSTGNQERRGHKDPGLNPPGGMAEPRIVTLTVNPAVDMACAASRVEPVHKVRTQVQRYDAGGGGLNVARVVRELGGSVFAVTTLGGETGRLLGELLDEAGLHWRGVPVGGRTRLSLTVLDRASNLEYRFVPEGPALSEAEQADLVAALEEAEGAWLVASGSLAPGVPVDFYARVIRDAVAHGRRVALDTSGPALRAALDRGLTLLKPSLAEFESLLGHEVRTLEAQMAEAMALARAGAAQMIALTLGRKGALLATAERVLHLPAVEVPLRSAVGAGDSFLAGLTLALARGWPEADALAFAVATGAAAVMHIGTAQVRRADVETLYARVRAEAAVAP